MTQILSVPSFLKHQHPGLKHQHPGPLPATQTSTKFKRLSSFSGICILSLGLILLLLVGCGSGKENHKGTAGHVNSESPFYDPNGGTLEILLQLDDAAMIRNLTGPSYSPDSLFSGLLETISAQRQASSGARLRDLIFDYLAPVLNPDSAQPAKTEFEVQKWLLNAFLSQKSRLHAKASVQEILDYIETEIKDGLNVSYRVLRSRLDEISTDQAQIRLIDSTSTIQVGLQSVRNSPELIRFLTHQGDLKFKETSSYGEGFELLQRIQAIILQEIKADSAVNPPAPNPVEKDSKVLLNDTTPKVLSLDSIMSNAATEEKADSVYRAFKRNNPLFFRLQLSWGINQASPLMGFLKPADTAWVMQWLRHPKVQDLFKTYNLKLYLSASPEITEQSPEETKVYSLIAVRQYGSELDGSVITTATMDFMPASGEPFVNLIMNSLGAKTWTRMTKKNVGKYVAILLDGRVLSYPLVQESIKGGRTAINGNFSVEEAKALAIMIQSGSFPAPLKVIAINESGPEAKP